NKISDYVNEILDVNKNNENLLLNSNNPSFYVHDDNRNLVLESDKYFSSKEYLLSRYRMSEDWEIGEKYYVTIKGKINDGNKFGVWNAKVANHFAFLKYNSELDLFRGSGIINSVWENDGFKTLSVYNYDRNNAEYSEIEWIKVEKNGFSNYSKAPEDKVHSQYPYSKIDDYNKYFENKESIKDVHIKNNDIHLDFKVDESLLERNKKYTFSFYARNKSKEDVRFVNEDLDMNFLIKKDEFKAYVDYIFIDEDMNVNDLLSRSKFVQESDEKDIHLDLFGFKLEKGLNKTDYLPNINDLEGGDLLSNIFNIDEKDNSNLLDTNIDNKRLKAINFDLETNNLIDNSNFDLINSPNYYPLSTIPKMYGGRYYTLSADIEYKNAKPGDQKRIGIEVKIMYEDGEVSFKGLWKYLESDKDNFNGRLSTTFKTDDKRVKNVSSLIIYTNLIESDYARISNPQLEEGKEVSPYKRSLNDLFKENENGINELVDVNQIKSKNVYTIEYFSSLNNYTYFDMEKLLKYKGPVEDSVYKLTKKSTDSTPPVYSYENNQNQQIIKNGESYTASI